MEKQILFKKKRKINMPLCFETNLLRAADEYTEPKKSLVGVGVKMLLMKKKLNIIITCIYTSNAPAF